MEGFDSAAHVHLAHEMPHGPGGVQDAGLGEDADLRVCFHEGNLVFEKRPNGGAPPGFVDLPGISPEPVRLFDQDHFMALVSQGEGQPTVRFTLPEGAENLEFQEGALGNRYIKTEDGFGDTIAVTPGQGQYEVLYAYTMPYDRKLELEQEVSLPVEAVVILVPEGGVKIKSDMLVDSGTQDVQGAKYRLFEGSSLLPGDNLRLSISGQPTTGQPTLPAGSNTSLMIGLAVFGLALVGAGVWLYRRTRSSAAEEEASDEEPEIEPEPASESVETLMDAIIALDDLYQAGQLPEDAYLKRRAELKARLQERMGNT